MGQAAGPVTGPACARAPGALIASVDPLGIAGGLGLAPGDRLLEVNGQPLRDMLDYLYLSAGPNLTIRAVQAGGQELVAEVEKDEGEPLGIGLADRIFDQVRECANRCRFCFVSQLPAGLRAPLYLRDDDLRLSVLDGNFVTLTNLTGADWDRLSEQRLGPLHVSIHTTDDRLRATMMGRAEVPPVLPQLRRLLDLGIEVHGQIVLCPGINDRTELDRTLGDLMSLPLASLAVVPVGLTSRALAGLRGFDPEGARAVLAQVAGWQSRGGGLPGSGLFMADEWYLLSGHPLPGAAQYGSYPQLANGVGMTRGFIDAWRAALRRLRPGGGPPRRVALVTGRLFAPVLRGLAGEAEARIAGLECEVLEAENRLFGGMVSVAGLLGGRDVLEAAREQLTGRTPDRFILPAELFRAAGDLTLDDMTAAALASALGAPVEVAASPRQAVRAMLGPPPPPTLAR